MHLPLGVPEKTEQKPVWRILRPGREKFLTKLTVLSDNHLFKQNIQQKQLQMNLSTYGNKIVRKFLCNMFQSKSNIKTDSF